MSFFRLIRIQIKRFKLVLKYRLSAKAYDKEMLKYLHFLNVDVKGKPKFIAKDVKFDLTDCSKIHIGKGIVITAGTTLLIHDYSIDCGLIAIGKEDKQYESLMIKDIFIGENCFIGQKSFIKPGTKIGNNCIIGAGSVVQGNIPDDSIVIGNPAQIVGNTKEWAQKKYNTNSFVQGNKRRKYD